MGAATYTFYNDFREALGDGRIDMDDDTFKVVLLSSSYTPDAEAHTTYADLTNELATANGYTQGGATLQNTTWVQSGSTVTFNATDVDWTATGGAISARYAVLYDSTASDALVAYILLDSDPVDVTAFNGGVFTLIWNVSGIFTHYTA